MRAHAPGHAEGGRARQSGRHGQRAFAASERRGGLVSALPACVPGGATVLEDTIVGAGLPWSGQIGRGDFLVLVDLEGQQAIDFLCYNAHDTRERYHAPNTIKLQGNIYLGQGSVLWSVRARRMMTITEDSCGGHDTIFGCCSFELDDVRYGQRNPRSCQLNFESELDRHGIDAAAVVPNVNFFMREGRRQRRNRGWMVQARRPCGPARGDGCPRCPFELSGSVESRYRLRAIPGTRDSVSPASNDVNRFLRTQGRASPTPEPPRVSIAASRPAPTAHGPIARKRRGNVVRP